GGPRAERTGPGGADRFWRSACAYRCAIAPLKMSNRAPEGHLLLLDACCLINLLATGRMEEILNVLPFRFATSRLIATKEVLTIARDEDGDARIEREVVPGKALENSG